MASMWSAMALSRRTILPSPARRILASTTAYVQLLGMTTSPVIVGGPGDEPATARATSPTTVGAGRLCPGGRMARDGAHIGAYRVSEMADWWSIEVFHGGSAAWMWWMARRDALIEAAVTHGALDWASHEHRWGVVFEVSFAEEWQWERY